MQMAAGFVLKTEVALQSDIERAGSWDELYTLLQ